MSKPNVEEIKAESRGLRGSLAAELANHESGFSHAAEKVLKFHGIYEQVDRDARKRDRAHDHTQFMVRSKLPGGKLSAEQYLVHDQLADEFGHGSLRITSRQDFQFHGVLKGNLKPTLARLNERLVTTLGACGDIVRNVLACPLPSTDPRRRRVQEFAAELSAALFPRTRAYHEIWLDGEPVVDEQAEADPLYGKSYLPRKFKIAIAFPGDNCVDVFTNDVGLVASFACDGTLRGFVLLAGGGMGMNHGNDATYARLADPICFITPAQVIPAVRACVTVHRDFGDRANRKHARLKYILQERGVAWFRQQLEEQLGATLPPEPLPPFEPQDHLGWHDPGMGEVTLGLPVENGRIVDRPGQPLKSTLRALVGAWQPEIRLTAQQNLLLCGLPSTAREEIAERFKAAGVSLVEQLEPVRRFALACVALPTCGQALTEAERVFPGVVKDFERLFTEVGLAGLPIQMRMTGCPNGCVRPYVAEAAFVGQSGDKYAIYLGGSPSGTRLAELFRERVPLGHLVPTLRPVFARFAKERLDREPFGDFVVRVGINSLLPHKEAPE